ncbi:MAG: GHKL domain-containing protein [Ruminococcaceae bacterium]|nr:GHKL domain-containing protein [Oscillospiraceae bacterium]
MQIINSVVSSVFEMYIGYMFFSKFAEKKFTPKVYFACLSAIILFLSLSSYSLLGSSVILIGFAFCVFLHSLLFELKWIKRILLILAIVVINALAEIIVVMAINIGLDIDINTIQSNSIMNLICTILAKFMGFAILKPIKSSTLRYTGKYPFWFSLSTAILPFTSIFIIIILFKYTYIIDTVVFQVSALIASMFLIVANILILIVVDKQENFYITKERLAFAEVHLKEQRTHYKELYAQQEALKKYRHDSKNFYTSLISVLETKNTEDAIELIKDKMSVASGDAGAVNSGNPVIDSIIYSKKVLCKDRGIIIEESIRLSNKIEIDELELGVLIGNALDNAIEATEKLESNDNKKINLKIITSGEMISVEVVNKVNTKVDVNNLKTTKEQKNEHGYGLKSIKTLALKYNGNLSISCENNEFVLSVILVNKNAKV